MRGSGSLISTDEDVVSCSAAEIAFSVSCGVVSAGTASMGSTTAGLFCVSAMALWKEACLAKTGQLALMKTTVTNKSHFRIPGLINVLLDGDKAWNIETYSVRETGYAIRNGPCIDPRLCVRRRCCQQQRMGHLFRERIVGRGNTASCRIILRHFKANEQ